jgi:hypothetical protein
MPIESFQQPFIFHFAPAHLMDRRNLVIREELPDSRVYALVNEEAHSASWSAAKSRMVMT